MTRNQTPHTAQKRRPPAHSGKPVKSPASDKAVAAVAGLREKDRARSAAASRKPAAGPRPALAHARINDSARPAEGRVALGKPADKRPLGIERRVPVMPDDRQAQLDLLIP